MKKFTTASDAGASRAKSNMATENIGEDPVRPNEPGTQMVDPSVRIGPIKEEIRGGVAMDSPAYTGKF